MSQMKSIVNELWIFIMAVFWEKLKEENDEMKAELDALKALKAKFEKTDMHAVYQENLQFQEKIEFGTNKLMEMTNKVEELT